MIRFFKPLPGYIHYLLQSMTHIITGVAGFIGSHIAETLLKQGMEVVGVDQINNYYEPSFKQQGKRKKIRS